MHQDQTLPECSSTREADNRKALRLYQAGFRSSAEDGKNMQIYEIAINHDNNNTNNSRRHSSTSRRRSSNSSSTPDSESSLLLLFSNSVAFYLRWLGWLGDWLAGWLVGLEEGRDDLPCQPPRPPALKMRRLRSGS